MHVQLFVCVCVCAALKTSRKECGAGLALLTCVTAAVHVHVHLCMCMCMCASVCASMCVAALIASLAERGGCLGCTCGEGARYMCVCVHVCVGTALGEFGGSLACMYRVCFLFVWNFMDLRVYNFESMYLAARKGNLPRAGTSVVLP